MQGLGVLHLQEKLDHFENVKTFFEDANKYMLVDVELLESDARADSRFVTALIERTAMENIISSFERLNKKFSEVSEGIDKFYVKSQNYLERTKLFLEISTQAADAGAYYIPVPYHTKVANEKNDLLKRCNKLLAFFTDNNIAVVPNKKTWFNLHLHLGNLLTYIRALAFGLETSDKREEAQKGLIASVRQIEAFENQADDKLLLTKTTKRLIGCEHFSQLPQGELYQSYIPPNLTKTFENFKNMMKNPIENLTKKELLNTVKVQYAEPVKLYSELKNMKAKL